MKLISKGAVSAPWYGLLVVIGEVLEERFACVVLGDPVQLFAHHDISKSGNGIAIAQGSKPHGCWLAASLCFVRLPFFLGIKKT